ncbi:hypothetical protein K456DRAFT_1724822 [Colletotrichum gloeosporioides 23]|nr:hypothetical protein K456DRAFT_1724822 [Colletotrichum gloeosporioides 23]
MDVTFELGIQHIWINSLCIIQDSKEDWTNESEMMGNVFRYAACNIAATSYQNGETGLFGDRALLPFATRLWHVDCLLVDYTRPDWKLKELRFNGFYMDTNLIDYQKHITFNDLNSRAWVAQERALSPSILHYTPGKIWWECNQLIANETFPLGDCAEWYQGLDPPEGNIRSLKKDDEESVYSFWRDFTNHYAGTYITFEKDRLAAAAGLAHTVGELLDDNFVAGFWEKDLINSLLWTPRRHALRQIRGFPTTQLVPSWSWASLCGELETWIYSLKPEFNTTDTQLSCISLRVLSDTVGFKSDLQLDSLETSAVRGLAIRGPLRKVSTDMLASTGFWRTYKSKAISSFSSWQDKKSLSPELVENIAHDQAWRLNDSTHLLPLKRTWNHKGIVGLLLQLVPGTGDQDRFRRSGCFHISFRTADERNIHECLGLLERDGVYQPGYMFEERGLRDIVLI